MRPGGRRASKSWQQLLYGMAQAAKSLPNNDASERFTGIHLYRKMRV